MLEGGLSIGSSVPFWSSMPLHWAVAGKWVALDLTRTTCFSWLCELEPVTSPLWIMCSLWL